VKEKSLLKKLKGMPEIASAAHKNAYAGSRNKGMNLN
jgi:hypothetical protein